MRNRYARLATAAQELVDAMETCHICRSTLMVEEGPVYCEDGCSSDCDGHDAPNCDGIDVLHARLKRALLDI